MASTGKAGAATRLMAELKDLKKEKWVNINLRDDSIFKWDLGLMVINEESHFNGGYFKAEMTFPESYPYSAPTFRFTRPIFHPNIYPDGRVCISILHPPGDDAIAGETASERWSPLQCVESVLRSILLLLDDAEINSPANVDASVMYRDNKQAFSEMAQRDVEVSKKDIPEGFVMPTSAIAAPPVKAIEDDGDFWVGSDDEDFGGSDSDMDMNEFDEEDDEEESAEDEETEE